jgi:hypothetical protein
LRYGAGESLLSTEGRRHLIGAKYILYNQVRKDLL